MIVQDDGVIGNVRFVPGGQTPFQGDLKNAVMPLLTGSNPQQTIKDFAGIQENIRKGFFNDLLQLPNKNYLTATEVQAWIERNYQLLGPGAFRLQEQLLTPVVERCFLLMN